MRMKAILSALAIVLFSFGLVRAGEINNVITFSPGVRRILPDPNSVPDSGINLYGANLAYKRYFIPNISCQLRTGFWRGEVSQDTDIEGQTVDISEEFTMVPATLSLNYEVLPDRRWNPYIGAGAGMDYIDIHWSVKAPGKDRKTGSSSDIGFSYYGVVGFDYFLTGQFGMGLDLSYNYAPKADVGGYDREMHNVAVLMNLNYAF